MNRFFKKAFGLASLLLVLSLAAAGIVPLRAQAAESTKPDFFADSLAIALDNNNYLLSLRLLETPQVRNILKDINEPVFPTSFGGRPLYLEKDEKGNLKKATLWSAELGTVTITESYHDGRKLFYTLPGDPTPWTLTLTGSVTPLVK